MIFQDLQRNVMFTPVHPMRMEVDVEAQEQTVFGQEFHDIQICTETSCLPLLPHGGQTTNKTIF